MHYDCCTTRGGDQSKNQLYRTDNSAKTAYCKKMRNIASLFSSAHEQYTGRWRWTLPVETNVRLPVAPRCVVGSVENRNHLPGVTALSPGPYFIQCLMDKSTSPCRAYQSRTLRSNSWVIAACCITVFKRSVNHCDHVDHVLGCNN